MAAFGSLQILSTIMERRNVLSFISENKQFIFHKNLKTNVSLNVVLMSQLI